ncbi:MAG: hypothetical protein J1F07_03000 [Muribaculaceae bacterium]|nr:hypothetical protein [Muribaculaceae bacterium]
MNKLFLTLFLVINLSCFAEVNESDLNKVTTELSSLNQKVNQLEGSDNSLNNELSEIKESLELMNQHITSLEVKSDSIDYALQNDVNETKTLTNTHHTEATEKIQVVESSSQTNYNKLAMWGLWSIVGLLLFAIIIYIILHKGISKSTNAISAIRAAQNNLEEESVKLDTKLIEILEKQVNLEKNQKPGNVSSAISPEIDHSLALKVADEITRIEKNLSRMDSSVKGYKPLVKAIDRIKDNFKANGYDIITYLGQPYNEGMRINAYFEIDEELPIGTRTITSVSKPQIHYNGQLVQKASVTVSQNI